MKNLIILFITLFIINSDAVAQAVARNVLLEHFTNTYCSVCANRNPGLQTNLANHPDVYHIAYYPSSPYPSCTLNQHNSTENDDRTHFYGVYGSTPRIVLQGVALPTNTQFYEPTLFDAALGQLSPFKIVTEIEQLNAVIIRVNTIIYKVDASPLTSADIYGAMVEDTLNFTSNNGEQHHYDVFRRNIWISGVSNIALPTVIGDSVVLTQHITLSNDWDLNKIYALIMLHNTDKTLIQTAKSANLDGALSMETTTGNNSVKLYPNPATDAVNLSGLGQEATLIITDVSGRQVLKSNTSTAKARLDVSALSPGIYFLSAKSSTGIRQFKLIKE